MAEIEHFCDPTLKDHPKFAGLADTEMMLYSACNQMDGKPPEKTKIGDAVKNVCEPHASFYYTSVILDSLKVVTGCVKPQMDLSKSSRVFTNSFNHNEKFCYSTWVGDCRHAGQLSFIDFHATQSNLLKKMHVPITKIG